MSEHAEPIRPSALLKGLHTESAIYDLQLGMNLLRMDDKDRGRTIGDEAALAFRDVGGSQLMREDLFQTEGSKAMREEMLLCMRATTELAKEITGTGTRGSQATAWTELQSNVLDTDIRRANQLGIVQFDRP